MNTTERGRWGETLAVIHLEKTTPKSYSAIGGGIDTRSTSSAERITFGSLWKSRCAKWGFGALGVEAVNSQKQERIIQAAHHFLRIHDINASQIRFDIISIEYNRHMRRINHIPDAFIYLPT